MDQYEDLVALASGDETKVGRGFYAGLHAPPLSFDVGVSSPGSPCETGPHLSACRVCLCPGSSSSASPELLVCPSLTVLRDWTRQTNQKGWSDGQGLWNALTGQKGCCRDSWPRQTKLINRWHESSACISPKQIPVGTAAVANGSAAESCIQHKL